MAGDVVGLAVQRLGYGRSFLLAERISSGVQHHDGDAARLSGPGAATFRRDVAVGTSEVPELQGLGRGYPHAATACRVVRDVVVGVNAARRIAEAKEVRQGLVGISGVANSVNAGDRKLAFWREALATTRRCRAAPERFAGVVANCPGVPAANVVAPVGHVDGDAGVDYRLDWRLGRCGRSRALGLRGSLLWHASGSSKSSRGDDDEYPEGGFKFRGFSTIHS